MIHTLFTGKHLIHLPEMASTNTFAAQYLANNSPIDGTVILTGQQTAGRGQKGNTWYSEPGNSLAFSIVYRTDFLPATRQFELNIAVSLGVAEALQSLCQGKEWSVKWPNDILAGQHKIAGILIENTIQGNALQYSIVGIGINVNQASFPQELPHAGSMKMTSGYDFDTMQVLDTVLRKIEARFLQIKSGGIAKLQERYREILFGYDKERRYRDMDGEFSGKITGVNERGQLLVIKEGLRFPYDLKEIEFLYD